MPVEGLPIEYGTHSEKHRFFGPYVYVCVLRVEARHHRKKRHDNNMNSEGPRSGTRSFVSHIAVHNCWGKTIDSVVLEAAGFATQSRFAVLHD